MVGFFVVFFVQAIEEEEEQAEAAGYAEHAAERECFIRTLCPPGSLQTSA